MHTERSRLTVHDAAEADLPFLQRMLYEAVNRPDEAWPNFDASIHEPRNVRFWKGFPREGDIGVVSQDYDAPIGAAWIRHFSGVELRPIYDPDVPVLAIGVEKHYRGRGVGQLLMLELLKSRAHTWRPGDRPNYRVTQRSSGPPLPLLWLSRYLNVQWFHSDEADIVSLGHEDPASSRGFRTDACSRVPPTLVATWSPPGFVGRSCR